MRVYEDGAYILPWERPPSWLYLPHLTMDQTTAERGHKVRKIDPAANQADEERHDEALAASAENERRADAEEAAAERARSEVGRIRGQDRLPGAWQRLSVGERPTRGGDDVITNSSQGDTGDPLRGRRREREGDDGIGGRHRSHGTEDAKRARTGSLTGLQWAFAEHAARVACKAERCKEAATETPADRMRALRLRIAARAKSSVRGHTCHTAAEEAATIAAQHGNEGTVERQVRASIDRPDLDDAGINESPPERAV